MVKGNILLADGLRFPWHLTHLIELLKGLQERGIEFISLTEQIDTTTPGGKLIFHLMGGFGGI